jgi:1-acyl-sn-glycerol-3-phosphate acyltransferase
VCWWGDAPFGPHARHLLQLAGIEARVEFLAEPHVDPDRKALAERLRTAIEARFQPIP